MIFFSKESKKKKKIFFEGGEGKEDWLVSVNLFYKDSKSKEISFLWGRGGGGGGGGGGERGGLSK